MVSARFGAASLRIPDERQIIEEDSKHFLSFNVMPSKLVTEELFVKRYEVAMNFIRVIFDRQYTSEMRDSPNHYIFWSSLMQAQKMAYVYMCWRFGIAYDPHGEEEMKIWPMEVDCKLSGLLSATNDCIQDLHVQGLKWQGCRNGSGRVDMDLFTCTPGKELLIRTTGAIYLPERQYQNCRAIDGD